MARRIVYKEMSWPEIRARGRPFRGAEAYGARLIEAWVERFAEMLREIQAKSYLAGRYRPNAYRCGQP
jgi:hypothetical protein